MQIYVHNLYLYLCKENSHTYVCSNITYTLFLEGLLPNEKSRLQITDPRILKTTTIDVSNIISVQPIIESRVITILLPNNTELKFKASSDQLLVSWVAALKVAIGKGMYVATYVYIYSILFGRIKEKKNAIFSIKLLGGR